MQTPIELKIPEAINLQALKKLHRQLVLLISVAFGGGAFVNLVASDTTPAPEIGFLLYAIAIAAFIYCAYSPKANCSLRSLTPDQLDKLIEEMRKHPELLPMIRNIQEQGREPIHEERNQINRYLHQKEERRKSKRVKQTWESL